MILALKKTCFILKVTFINFFTKRLQIFPLFFIYFVCILYIGNFSRILYPPNSENNKEDNNIVTNL